MTAPRRIHDDAPQPTPPAAALAAPCRSCLTTRGFTVRGTNRPTRCQGYCSACYQRLRASGAIGQADSNADDPAQVRAWARQHAIRTHLGPHITEVESTGIRPMPWPRYWGNPQTDPLAHAAWADEPLTEAA